MTQQFEKLRNTVLAEVRRQYRSQPHPNHMKVLARFVKENLRRRQHTPDDLAHELGVPLPVVELLISGKLPEWMLSDRFVVRLAKGLRCEPNILRVMMNREITPIQDDSLASG